MLAPNLRPRKVPTGKEQMSLKKVQWVRIRRGPLDTGGDPYKDTQMTKSQSEGMTRAKQGDIRWILENT